jgi:DNA-binding transcriptional LysR family regulator
MDELSIKDFRVLAELPHHPSLRSLARSLHLEAQHLSKIVKSIETKLGQKLLLRSPQGISPTAQAIEWCGVAERVLVGLKTSDEASTRKAKQKVNQLTIVSRVFMNTYCSPIIAQMIEREMPQFSLRFVDASPRKKEEWARQGLAELILSIGQLDLGKMWEGQECGKIDWNFYSRTNHPIGSQTTIEKMQEYPIIGHAYIDEKRLIETNRMSTAKVKSHSTGFMAETTITCMNIAASTNQITYLPELITRDSIKAGRLQRLHVRDLASHSQKVFLYAHLDKVQRSFYHRLINQLSSHLN